LDGEIYGAEERLIHYAHNWNTHSSACDVILTICKACFQHSEEWEQLNLIAFITE